MNNEENTLNSQFSTINYKDSGVEWIGEIPEGWEVKKLKHVADAVLGKMLTNSDKGGYQKRKYLRAANVEWLNVNITDVKEMWFSEDELERLRIAEGDLLVSEGGEVGRSCLWRNELAECYIQNSVHKVTFNLQNNATFFLNQFFLMGEKGVFDSIVNRISIAHLTGEKLKEISIICPPLEAQTTIANYLDRKTAEIDELIAQKERLLELYEEEKTAVIEHAVTGRFLIENGELGIENSQLSTLNCKFKPSDVDWLGEIPEGWEVKKLKYVANLKSGNNLTSNQIKEVGEYPVYGGNGLRGYYGEYNHEGEFILIGRQGALCGNINYAKGKFWATDHAVVAQQNIKYEFIWLGELLRTMNLNQYSVAAAQPGLAVEAIKNLFIPYPPPDDQTAIVHHIETQTARINAKIAKTKKIIALQKEYRTALISEVVTGKLRIEN